MKKLLVVGLLAFFSVATPLEACEADVNCPNGNQAIAICINGGCQQNCQCSNSGRCAGYIY